MEDYESSSCDDESGQGHLHGMQINFSHKDQMTKNRAMEKRKMIRNNKLLSLVN